MATATVMRTWPIASRPRSLIRCASGARCDRVDHADPHRRRGRMPTMKFWLLRPKGFDHTYTDTESCWGCVVRAPDRETALALAATSELRLSGDFPDGWDVTEVPADGPP